MSSGAQPSGPHTAASVKPNTGSEAQTCRRCLRNDRDTRETISNGLRLIRIRYGLPHTELPDLRPSDLTKYLSFLLLQGQKRASVPFPRSQRGRDKEGFSNLQRMWKHERWEFAHSVASIKRSLPGGCQFHSTSARPAWQQVAFSTPPPHLLVTWTL